MLGQSSPPITAEKDVFGTDANAAGATNGDKSDTIENINEGVARMSAEDNEERMDICMDNTNAPSKTANPVLTNTAEQQPSLHPLPPVTPPRSCNQIDEDIDLINNYGTQIGPNRHNSTESEQLNDEAEVEVETLEHDPSLNTDGTTAPGIFPGTEEATTAEPGTTTNTTTTNPVDVDPDLIDAFQDAWSEAYEQSKKDFGVPNADSPPAENDPEGTASRWFDSLCDAIHSAANCTLPVKKNKPFAQRDVSERTKALIKQRKQLARRGATRSQYKRINRQIKESSRLDFVSYVEKSIDDIEKANLEGNTARVYKVVNNLANKPKPPPVNLTRKSDGSLLKSPDEVAATWHAFLQEKFSPTEREMDRDPMQPLPPQRTPEDDLT